MEEAVAATVLLTNKRRTDGAAYLGLLQCVNDGEALERLLGAVTEQVGQAGCRRIIGPTGLSPHLESGVLQNYFQLAPPLHTPYHPPYLSELLEGVMEPLAQSHLFTIAPSTGLPSLPAGPARLTPLHPALLSTDYLPLLAAACAAQPNFPPPDAAEAAFLIDWLQSWPLFGWLASVHEQPVGFVLLQADVAPSLRTAGGGRNLLWRLWLAGRSRRPMRNGRLLLGGVLPAWRNQGIGCQLWQQSLHTARQHAWQSLTVGPVVDATPGAAFLHKQGAQTQQRYLLYASDP